MKTRRTCWCGEPAEYFVMVPDQDELCAGCYADWHTEYVEGSPDAAYLGEAFSHIPSPQ